MPNFKKPDIKRLKIKDTGIGFNEFPLKSVFSPFTQIDGGLTRIQDGAGLGLTISQNLAKLLGEKI